MVVDFKVSSLLWKLSPDFEWGGASVDQQGSGSNAGLYGRPGPVTRYYRTINVEENKEDTNQFIHSSDKDSSSLAQNSTIVSSNPFYRGGSATCFSENCSRGNMKNEIVSLCNI